MASILNSKARCYRYTSDGNEEADHCIESEADYFIKNLSQKQLETNVTLEQHLNQKKEFHSTHTYQPVTELTAGTIAFEDFKKLESKEENVSNSSRSDETSQPENKSISRHVRDLALAVKPNSLETKLLKFAISCNAVGDIRRDTRPVDHPINQLDDIEHELFGHLSDTSNPRQTAQTILRKRKQLLEAVSEPIEVKKKPISCSSRSLWDVTEPVKNVKKSEHPKLYSCRKEKLFTIRNGVIVEITNENKNKCNSGVEEPVTTIENQRKDRLTEAEMKAIPRFSDYQKGIPSTTLYLKNLSSSVKEEDLVSLFSKYQDDNKSSISYTLMQKGKMRGQAFINFHNIETAVQAMEEVNGVILHGKPIVIQFGCSRK